MTTPKKSKRRDAKRGQNAPVRGGKTEAMWQAIREHVATTPNARVLILGADGRRQVIE